MNKILFALAGLLLFAATLKAQNIIIEYDCKTQTFDPAIKNLKLPVGSIINITIINLSSGTNGSLNYDAIKVEASFGNRHTENLQRYSDLVNTNALREVPVPKFHLRPIQINNADYTNLKFTFFNTGNEIDHNTIILSNKRGLKIDASTGFFITSLADEVYKLKTVIALDSVLINDTMRYQLANKKRIYEEDFSKLDMQLALLIHAYWRSGGALNFSFTSGVAVNMKSQRPNYLIGASLLLGREQRFVLSGGVNFGLVKKLSNAYTIGDLMSLETENVPMTEKIMAGGWFGISYNFGHLN